MAAIHSTKPISKTDTSSETTFNKAKWLLAGASMVAIATATTGTANAACVPAPANGVTTTCDETDLNAPLFFDDLNVTFSHTTPGNTMVSGVAGTAIYLNGNGAQNLTITDDLDASIAGGFGIDVSTFTDTANPGSVTIDTTAASVVSDLTAIEGWILGTATGDLTITTGDITSNSGIGIFGVTLASGGSVAIDTTAGSVSSNGAGILVDHDGTGDTTIITADVTSTISNGLQINHSANSGDLTIDTSAGAVSADDDGININQDGTGAVTVTTADVTSANDDGIFITTDAATLGDVTLDTTAGTVTSNGAGGGDRGIEVINAGAGTVSVITADVSVAAGDSINIVGTANSGDISLDTSQGTVTSGIYDGIQVTQIGTAAISITSGVVNAGTGAGAHGIEVLASTSATDVTIDATAGAITTANGDGINVDHDGTGAVSVTTADISATGGDGVYINGDTTTTDLTIDTSAGTVTGDQGGIFSSNGGTGPTTIITADVTSTGGFSIAVQAYNAATAGDMTIDTTAGAVSVGAGGIGIAARNFGAGANTNVSTGDVSGGAFGILAISYGVNTVNVDGAVTGTTTGITSYSVTGSNITISATGSVTGPVAIITDSAPPGAAVNDTITNAGTIDGGVTTLLGDDTFTSTGIVTAASIVNLGADNDTANIGGTFDGTLDLDTGNDILNITDLAGIGNGTFDGNAGTDDINIVGTTGNFDAGDFSNFENLGIDNSIVTLISNGTFAQTNVINSGSLDLGGQTLTSLVNVDGTSTLSGSGNIVGNTVVDGTINLAATDLIDITGNLTLNGQLDTDYNAGAVGSVNVSGTATTGALQTVNLTVIDPTGLSHGTVIPVIVTGGGTTHNGSGLATDNFAGLDFAVSTLGNNLVLTAAANFNGTPSGDNNVDNAANAIQSLATTPGAFAANPFLFTLASAPTLADMQQGIDELSPADGGSIPSVMKSNARLLADAVPTACFDNRPSASDQTCADISNGGRVWGSVGFANEKGDRQQLTNNDLNESDHDTTQIAIGGMYAATQALTVGGGLAYQDSSFEESGRTLMDGSADGFGVFGHVNYQMSNMEVYGAVGHNKLSFDHSRAIPLLTATASASHDASTTFVKAGVRGAVAIRPTTIFIPEASITHLTGSVDGYQETGTPAGLSVEGFDVESTFGAFGGRLEARNLGGAGAATKANGYLGYTYLADFNNDDQLMRASFQGGGNSFDTLLASEGDSSHLINAGVHGYFGNGFEYQLDVSKRLNDEADETKISVRVGKGW